MIFGVKPDKKEKEKINNNTRGDNNMKKIITKTSEEARREKERELYICPECGIELIWRKK